MDDDGDESFPDLTSLDDASAHEAGHFVTGSKETFFSKYRGLSFLSKRFRFENNQTEKLCSAASVFENWKHEHSPSDIPEVSPIFQNNIEDCNRRENRAEKSYVSISQNVESSFWKWEYSFFVFAAHKFLRQCIHTANTEIIEIPVPRSFRHVATKVKAKLICAGIDPKHNDIMDCSIIAINGKVVNKKNFDKELRIAKEFHYFYWKTDPYALIIHYGNEVEFENENPISCEKIKLLLPSQEILGRQRQESDYHEDPFLFAGELSNGGFPMFPFSDLNRSPPFYGDKIKGVKIGIYHELIHLMNSGMGEKRTREVESFRSLIGTQRNFDVRDFPAQDSRDQILNCFQRAFQYTIEILQTHANSHSLRTGTETSRRIMNEAFNACQSYKAHFENCMYALQ